MVLFALYTPPPALLRVACTQALLLVRQQLLGRTALQFLSLISAFVCSLSISAILTILLCSTILKNTAWLLVVTSIDPWPHRGK